MSLVSEQLSKLNPNSGASQLLGRVRAERAQAQQAQATAANSLAAIDAGRAAQDAQQAQLESEHGKLATAGTQFGRGILDAILAPGALVGMAAEGAGSALGSEGLAEFGRDLGRSSNADAGIEAASFLFGGGGKHGLTTAERVSRDVNEQQQAWPGLSALSHTGGMVGVGLLGGLAGAGSKAAATIGLGAMEGAAGGAQAGYERNASLRDVLSSAMVGGALGAGAAGAGEGLSGLIRNPALKAATRELAEDANLKAAGIGRSDLVSAFGEEAGKAEAKATELAGELATYKFQSGPLQGKPLMRVLKTPEGIREGVAAAQQETQAIVESARQEAAQQLAANPETAHFAQAIAAGDDAMVAKGMTAAGMDPAPYIAAQKQAQAFQELGALIEKAGQSGAKESSMGNLLGAAATIGGFVHGVPSLPAIAHGLLTKIGSKVVEQRAASTVAVLANNLVTDTVSGALERIVPVVSRATAGAGGREMGTAEAEPKAPKKSPSKQLTPEEKQDRYREQLEQVSKAVSAPDPVAHEALVSKYSDLPAPLLIAASADMSQKMAQLHADMPKPKPDIRGKSHETLSSDQVRLANAMYEATVEPMSVFSDFEAGTVDYDKVRYAWKQYPGLKDAAQAGLMDIFHAQLSDESRAAIPDSLLSQLDNLFGFDGKLQPSLDHGFASRMGQLAPPEHANPPPRSGPLKLPTSQPTFTQRIAGVRP